MCAGKRTSLRRHAALLHEFPAAPLPVRAMRQTHLADIDEMSSNLEPGFGTATSQVNGH
jgi:hypothetical protein